MNNNPAIIIQARLASERFPNKMFANINGKFCIEHVIEECLKVENISVNLAVPTYDMDSFKFIWHKNPNVRIFGGPTGDVLARYYSAAYELKTDILIRITGDCPCIEPKIITNMLSFFKSSSYDYISNMTIRHALTEEDKKNYTSDTLLSDGFSVEIFSYEALKQAFYQAKLPYEREHVTSWIKKNMNCGLYSENMIYIHGKLSLDQEEDLEAIRAYLLLKKKGYINVK